MRNIDYFKFSAVHPEPLLDANYSKGVIVIPSTSSENNQLTTNNSQLIELISAFRVLRSNGASFDDPHVSKIVLDVISILDSTSHINLSAFSQFFCVYSCSYDAYKRLKKSAKVTLIREMLTHFTEERHAMYLSHGYSNAILQVVSDNYSHKRNCKTTIEKVTKLLTPFGFCRQTDCLFDTSSFRYFLPDKGDNPVFTAFTKHFSIEYRYGTTEQGKLPDMVFSIGKDWFIVEMKNIKGAGGGQDKQLVEIIKFIRFSEKNSMIHYLVFLDGDYANRLFERESPKIELQYNEILKCLRKNPGNFFLNTSGFEKFLSDYTSFRQA